MSHSMHEDMDCCHEDEHSHEHHHHGHSHDGIRFSRHEEALIGAMSGILNALDFDDAERMLSLKIREIGHRVTAAGGIIGHIKFLLISQGKSCQISVTDVEETIRRFEAGNYRVEGVAIVFCIDETQLHQILQETLGTILTLSTE